MHDREKHPRVCSALKTPLSLESLQHLLQKWLPRAHSFLLPVKTSYFFPMWQVQIALPERRSSQLASKWRWTTAPSVDAIAETGGNLRSACGGNASTVRRRRISSGATSGDANETCTGSGLTYDCTIALENCGCWTTWDTYSYTYCAHIQQDLGRIKESQFYWDTFCSPVMSS